MQTTEVRYSLARLRPVNGVKIKRVKLERLEWSIEEVISQVDPRKYRYLWFETIDLKTTYEEDRITCVPTIGQRSPKYFINAYVETYEDVCINNSTVAKQMTNLGWTHIVRNIGEVNLWTERFDPECDKLIDLKGELSV
jgi:hypothetical protein